MDTPQENHFQPKQSKLFHAVVKKSMGGLCLQMDGQTDRVIPIYTPTLRLWGGGGIKSMLATKQRDLCKHGIYMYIYYCTPFMIHTFFKMSTWKQFMLNLALPRRPQLMMIFSEECMCVWKPIWCKGIIYIATFQIKKKIKLYFT